MGNHVDWSSLEQTNNLLARMMEIEEERLEILKRQAELMLPLAELVQSLGISFVKKEKVD